MNQQRAFPADAGAFPEAKELLEQFGTAESAGSMAVKAGVLENFEAILSSPGLRKLLKPPTTIEDELHKILAGELPPPEAYPRERSKDKEAPEAFLRRVWGKFLDDGCLYLDQLRAIDPGLVITLHNRQMYYKMETTKIVPTREQRIDSYVEGVPEHFLDRIKWIGNALNARERMRKTRGKNEGVE